MLFPFITTFQPKFLLYIPIKSRKYIENIVVSLSENKL